MEVDSPEQMDLAFDARDGTAMGLVGPTVFALGADDRYRQRRVTGPLSEQEFHERAASLKLPPFQKVFRDLQ